VCAARARKPRPARLHEAVSTDDLEHARLEGRVQELPPQEQLAEEHLPAQTA
jgi:hypothetical protein